MLGAVALILSLLISGAGLIRSWRLDARTAKKQDIDTVIENYRALLTESRTREKKLEDIIDEQKKALDKSERIIDEQRITIGRLEASNRELKIELGKYRADHPLLTASPVT
jgi:septal ring factor EnvC (AmiA/AmiB activator)